MKEIGFGTILLTESAAAQPSGDYLVYIIIIIAAALLAISSVIFVFYLKHQEKAVKKMADELSSYKSAVLADATIIFDADITNNVISGGLWKGVNGKIIELESVLDIKLPCTYDEYILKWANKFVGREYREMFLQNTSREYLMTSFVQGKKEISFDYLAKAADGSNMTARRSIYLAYSENRKAVIAYSNVKNVTQQKLQETQMHQYEQMLITVASGMYEGIRVVDLSDFTSTFVSFEGGKIATQDIGNWMSWLYHQRSYLSAEDYKSIREALGEESLRAMPLNSSFSVDFSSAVVHGDSAPNTYRATVFKSENGGKEYAYVVMVQTSHGESVKKV